MLTTNLMRPNFWRMVYFLTLIHSFFNQSFEGLTIVYFKLCLNNLNGFPRDGSFYTNMFFVWSLETWTSKPDLAQFISENVFCRIEIIQRSNLHFSFGTNGWISHLSNFYSEIKCVLFKTLLGIRVTVKYFLCLYYNVDLDFCYCVLGVNLEMVNTLMD